MRLRYLDNWIDVDLSGFDVRAELRTPDPGQALETAAQIEAALGRPLGQDQGLLDLVAPGEQVVITVADWTRQTAIDRVLAVLLAAWERRGVSLDDVTILVACGTHRPPREEELDRILGPALRARLGRRVVVHQAHEEDRCREVGVTSRGTPVRINEVALEAERLIVTGAVKLHYFGGFGGGRKGVLPGVAAASSISANHRLNIDLAQRRLDPEVRIGRLEGNPVSDDMDEAAALVRVDALINTVLDGRGRLAGLFSGALREAHRAAARLAEQLYCVALDEPADLVLAATAGERNWVQSHKCLYNAWLANKPGGVIVMLAPCPEGLGNESFARWVGLGSVEAVMDGLVERSEIYGQTALSTLMRGRRAILVSELSDEQVRRLGMTAARSVDQALRIARQRLAAAGVERPTACVMPQAGLTVPVVG